MTDLNYYNSILNDYQKCLSNEVFELLKFYTSLTDVLRNFLTT